MSKQKKDGNWFAATANKHASDWMRGRVTTESRGMRKLAPEIRAHAFSVAGIADMKVLSEIKELVAKLTDGASWDAVKNNIAAEISEQWGGPKDGDPAKYVAAVERRAELVLRQNAFQAYAVARYQDQQEVKAAFPYLIYLTVGDGNVRDEHAALDGLILPVDDAFWQGHYPPWDFGCRCMVESISAEEAEERGITSPERIKTIEQRMPTRADKDYNFRPDTLMMDVAEIAAREYADTDFLFDFEARMKSAMIQTEHGEMSVWEMLEGKGKVTA